MADLRVCVIGTGAMGTDHIIRINTRMSGAVVTAIVEPDSTRAAAALKTLYGVHTSALRATR